MIHLTSWSLASGANGWIDPRHALTGLSHSVVSMIDVEVACTAIRSRRGGRGVNLKPW